MKRSPSLQLDESVVVSKVHKLYELPPMLYVDDYNVITEVPDVRTLQEGDHCVVGLNVLHNMLPWTDAVISRLTSWEALPLRFYHHFIIIDSVAALSADGLPLAADLAAGRRRCRRGVAARRVRSGPQLGHDGKDAAMDASYSPLE